MTSTRTSDCIEISVMRSLCKRFKGSYAENVLRSLGSGVTYLNLDLPVHSYTNAEQFGKDLLLYSFLRKWKGWSDVNDPKLAAINSWTAAERSNYATNRRLSQLNRIPVRALNLINEIQRKIISVIGLYPDFRQLDDLCKWGPGATFDIRRGNTDPSFKMSQTMTVTQRCVPHLDRILDELWKGNVRGDPFTIVKGNRCVTVPKNAKTDRMIAAEPTVNSFLQQGVGRYFRKRLKAFGINLDDQTINQELAFRALLDEMSTLDLSMASDSLSLALVALLLPPEWVTYLCDLRSPYSFLDGKWYKLEKFSSMGNAFTFELETLIFWAISSCVSERSASVSVYGDDIICKRDDYNNIVSALSYFGFTVNQDKSYRDGHFFESCGKQYFDLEDVTPAYQKEVAKSDLSELIRLHNRIYRWGQRSGMHLVKDALKLVLDFTRTSHPRLRSEKFPRTPYVEGDRGFYAQTTDFKRNKHGDFACNILESYSTYKYGIVSQEVNCMYSLKLRSPSVENQCPDGHFGLLAEERTRLRKRVIWASSLIV